MLIVNWRKHYYVPSLFFNDSRYTSTRKGKFFFLSDFLFKILHKFRIKVCLFYYVRYFTFHRFEKTCNHMNKHFISQYTLSKRIFDNTLSNFFTLSSVIKQNRLYKIKIDNKRTFLLHLYAFTNLFYFIKKKIITLIRLFYYNKITVFSLVYFYCTKIFAWSAKHDNKMKYYKSNNILSLLYQIIFLRLILPYHLLSLKSFFYFCAVYLGYVKTITFPGSKNNTLFIENKNYQAIKKSYLSLHEDVKSKHIFDISNHTKKNYILYSHFFTHNFYQLFSYFFFIRRLHSYNSLRFLNYISLLHLKDKKNIFHRFRTLLRTYGTKFTKYRSYYMFRFYKFLIRLLYAKKNWLLGPVHKIKFFKYIFSSYRKLKVLFKGLFLYNSPHSRKKNNLSFFFNSAKVREHFFIYLGKRKYSEEFLLLKNEKWYLNFFIQNYYHIDSKLVEAFYNVLRKKFKLVKVKDLFLFLEYYVSVFLKKFLYTTIFSFTESLNTDLLVNDYKLNVFHRHFFFIGDYPKLNSIDLVYEHSHIKYYTLFHILYFINPFYFHKKSILILFIYHQLFTYSSNKFKYFFPFSYQIFSDSDNIPILIDRKYFYYVSLLNMKNWTSTLNHENYIKLLYLLYKKYYFQNMDDLNHERRKTEKDLFYDLDTHYPFTLSSLNKSFFKYKIIELEEVKKVSKKQIRKPFFLFKHKNIKNILSRRKRRMRVGKFIQFNLYNLYKHINTPSYFNTKKKFHGYFLYKKLILKNYRGFSHKKYFFSERSNKLFKLINR